MRLKISHRTEYRYDAPLNYALQRVRIAPLSGPTQKVIDWRIDVAGAREEVRFVDHFGKDTRLFSVDGNPDAIAIEASGEIETKDLSGVTGGHRGFAPLWLFQQNTPLTEPGERIRELAKGITGANDIERLHMLMAVVAGRVAYTIGATEVATTAEAALERGAGVCQDHAHVFVAAARLLGMPARYVSGYLLMDGTVDQVATHAWAEAHVDPLGWVAFDPANGISEDGRYVRLAVGRDYRDAMPMAGILLGSATERLAVRITVEQ